MEQDGGGMQPAAQPGRFAIEGGVIMGSGLPAHAPDQTDRFHVRVFLKITTLSTCANPHLPWRSIEMSLSMRASEARQSNPLSRAQSSTAFTSAAAMP